MNRWSHKPVSLNGRLGNSEIGGCKEPFANPLPTLRQPCAPTLRQPFANLSPTLCRPFCQPLSDLLFPWTPGTRLETRVNGFLVNVTTVASLSGNFCWACLGGESSVALARVTIMSANARPSLRP